MSSCCFASLNLIAKNEDTRAIFFSDVVSAIDGKHNIHSIV